MRAVIDLSSSGVDGSRRFAWIEGVSSSSRSWRFAARRRRPRTRESDARSAPSAEDPPRAPLWRFRAPPGRSEPEHESSPFTLPAQNPFRRNRSMVVISVVQATRSEPAMDVMNARWRTPARTRPRGPLTPVIRRRRRGLFSPDAGTSCLA